MPRFGDLPEDEKETLEEQGQRKQNFAEAHKRENR